MEELALAEKLLDPSLSPKDLIKKLEGEGTEARVLVAVKRLLQTKAIQENEKQEIQVTLVGSTESLTGIVKRDTEGNFQIVNEESTNPQIKPS